MHSRILQLERKPDFERATEGDLEEMVSAGIADYVVELRTEEAIQDALEWFTGHYGGMTIGMDENDNTVIRIASRLDPLSRKLVTFQDKIKNLDLEKFCDFWWALSVVDLLGDRYGFYVWRNGYGYEKADMFFRNLKDDRDKSADNNIVLYVGTIFDYHS